MNKAQHVRDSFLQEIDKNSPTGVMAMVIPAAEMEEPERVHGMRVWLQDGSSVIGLFFDEDYELEVEHEDND